MISLLNSFLNYFEIILKRCLLVCFATIAFPFIMVAFVFGLINLQKINTEEDED
jgi:hypothetical protein